MPGHIGTDIVTNTRRVHVGDGRDDLGDARQTGGQGTMRPPSANRGERGSSGGEAAAVILDGVRNDEWRILVGEDADSTPPCVPTRSAPTAPTVSRCAASPAEVTRGRRRIQQPRVARLPVAVDQAALGEQLR